jgi:hypothetical protein
MGFLRNATRLTKTPRIDRSFPPALAGLAGGSEKRYGFGVFRKAPNNAWK